MGNLIINCIGKKGFEKLPNGSKYTSLFDIKISTLLSAVSEAPQPLSVHCEGKTAILCVNVASKWGLTDKNYKEMVQMYKELAPGF